MSEVWTAIQTNFIVFIMVLARTSGIFSFNPIFRRQGVPNTIRIGCTLALALVMTIAGGYKYTMPGGLLPFVFDLAKELLVGAVLGLFVNVLLSCFALAGEITDMQIGLSMAKSYDPTMGQSGASTNYFMYWFVLYFFACGAHLSYIELFAASYESIPIGYSSFNINILIVMVRFIEATMTLGLKLAMPIIAAELVTEFSIGVLMKAVPSIHVFVLNIQIKMIVGFIVLFAMAPVVSEFMVNLMNIMFENLNRLVEGFV